MNPKVDWFFEKETKWQLSYERLRELILACKNENNPIEEELKWGCPCYTINKNNFVLIHGFKDYCALLFMKGVLIDDTNDLLIQQTENVQAARQLRFSSLQEIEDNSTLISNYIQQAIKIELDGRKVEMKTTTEFKMVAEFQTVLEEMSDVKKSFEALTPGRQRAYLLYFAQAKQAKTRESRIEKYIPKILEGKGLED